MSHNEKLSDPTKPAALKGRPSPLLNYFATLRRFSRNAKLFLIYALLSGLGTGVWNVMFNIYLLRLGYATTFVGLFWMVDMLFHGLFAFPRGSSETKSADAKPSSWPPHSTSLPVGRFSLPETRPCC